MWYDTQLPERFCDEIRNVLEEKKLSEAEPIYKKAVSAIDKMVNSGQLKKNTAARRKSRLTRHLNSLNK